LPFIFAHRSTSQQKNGDNPDRKEKKDFRAGKKAEAPNAAQIVLKQGSCGRWFTLVCVAPTATARYAYMPQ
jgi:hypothetical protein